MDGTLIGAAGRMGTRVSKGFSDEEDGVVVKDSGGVGGVDVGDDADKRVLGGADEFHQRWAEGNGFAVFDNALPGFVADFAGWDGALVKMAVYVGHDVYPFLRVLFHSIVPHPVEDAFADGLVVVI